MLRRLTLAVAAFVPLVGPALADGPSLSGGTGLIAMPSARFAPDGSWRSGISFLRPYHTLWTHVTVFPWLEGGFRYVRTYDVPGFPDDPESDYGDHRDKAFDLKFRLLPERTWLPALAIGMHDAVGGTGIQRSPYVVASKRFGTLDFTLGYGKERIDGAFGGVRWYPSRFPNWSVVAEYDAFNYRNDFGAQLSGAIEFKKEAALGIEYRYGWLGAQVFGSHHELGFNAYVSVPLEQREWVPKTSEPRPYTLINPRPTEVQWQDDRTHAGRLVRALDEQGFHDIRIGYRQGRLEASLGNSRISELPRAVGRAARTLLSFAPLETHEIRILYVERSLPVATYTFSNIPLLQRYFNGMASREQLAPSVSIEYADPDAVREQADRADALESFLEPLPEGLVLSSSGVDFISLRGRNILGGRVLVRPSFSTFLNDPSGIFKYDISLTGSYDRPLGNNLFFQAQSTLSLYEDISDADDESNSDLPNVRTDYGLYNQNRLKLTKLLLNKFFHTSERVYSRISGGIYEEMFSGVGGQVLYLGRGGGWGVDLDTNWVRKRDFDSVFGLRDYRTVTALASLNYRMAKGVTGTLRAGRFLAKDEGVRFEIKRRFASNWEAGAWYTVTNGNDIQSPGEPGSPYYDKGIYLLWRLHTLLAYDTQATTSIALSPWTRDVGQMVDSPGDLYSILEDSIVHLHYRGGLSRLGDRDDDYDLPSLGTGRDRIWPDFVADDFFNLGAGARINWLKTAVGAGLLLGSIALDENAFKHFDRHKDSRGQQKAVDFGNALPLVALGLSGVFAFDESRPRLSDAGAAALEASALALVATEGLKWGVGRARPDAGLGNSEFEPGNSQDRFKSFPSRHTSVMWAAITPYAKEFDMPWLYAVAALTNVARVASREHWVSDTVGGSLLGYALGHLTWAARRESRYGSSGPSVVFGPGSLGLAWKVQ